MALGFVQFFRMGSGQSVERIVKEGCVPLQSAKEFVEMARPALKDHWHARRGKWRPDAIRLVDGDGQELFRWTMFDEHLAHQRDIQTAHQEARAARRADRT